MILISHRGNTEGSNPERENTQSYIEEALAKGFDVEVDVWGKEGKMYLGHDSPSELIPLFFLSKQKIWVHAKNVEAVDLIRDWHRKSLNKIHWFWHEKDHMTLTSMEYLWVYPGKELPYGSIAVLPENDPEWNIEKARGICSDYVSKYAR